MRFEFATSSRIIFGAGTVEEIAPLARNMGSRVVIVTGRTTERAQTLIDSLETAGLQTMVYSVSGEPRVDHVDDGVRLARDFACDLVIGMGGGSVIDTAKAVSALLTNTGEVLDYLEVIGQGKKLTVTSAPCIAVPTTAGTGAEVTRNSVLSSPQHRVKVSLRSPMMLPDLAVVDPELTYSMPPALTASTGLDALTQVLEPLVSSLSNPLSDTFCREGLTRAARSLRRCYLDGNDRDAREDMAITSLCGGLALTNAKLGAVHGFAGPIGGMYPIPHGTVCAILLPHVHEANIKALERRNDNRILQRFDEVAQIVTGKPASRASDAIEWLLELSQDLKITGLSTFGIEPAHFPDIIIKSRDSSSMKGNPVDLDEDSLAEILHKAL